MSLRRDVDVAGVRVEARHVPELVARLQRAGFGFVASKVQRTLHPRTVPVAFGVHEREALLRAVDDGPPPFSELYLVLRREIERRDAEGLT